MKEIIGEGSVPIRSYYYKDGRLDYLVDARGTDDAKQTFEYDSLNRLTHVKYYDTDDVTILEEYDITYNTKDQITDEDTTTRYGSSPVTTAKDYTYDNLGRMISETTNSVETDYTYDAVGNRISMTTGGTALYYQYNVYDQLVCTATDDDFETADILSSYVYDLPGNQISKTDGDTVGRYYYDDANWLTSATEQIGQGTENTLASFAYDAVGQRTQKAAGSNETNYYYSGLQLLYTKDGNGDIIEQNVLEPDGSIIDSRRADDSDYWYRQDIRGSVTNIVDVNDDLVKSYTYDAYGNTQSTGTFINSFAYTGAVIDTETGLYYMNARYYDPENGRFISEDSYRGDGEAFWHSYLYCEGDPVNSIDPTGHYITKAPPHWTIDQLPSLETIIARMINDGRTMIGRVKYKMGGKASWSMSTGKIKQIDCSGFVSYLFTKYLKDTYWLPRQFNKKNNNNAYVKDGARYQVDQCKKYGWLMNVSKNSNWKSILKPGNLVFYHTSSRCDSHWSKVTHVGIYIGNHLVLQSTEHDYDGVQILSLEGYHPAKNDPNYNNKGNNKKKYINYIGSLFMDRISKPEGAY